MSTNQFENFTTKDLVYKTVNGHPIETTILVPRNATGQSPVLVHLHGGFLIIGDRMIWFAKWLIQLAESKGAIIVSPNYRLMPEASGKDILDDLTSFYAWLKSSLPAEVSKLFSGVEADLSQILVAGESAGGYLAAQSALHFPEMKFKAIISQYGMIDMENPHFTLAGHKNMAGTPHLPVGVVDDYLATIKKDAVRTSTLPPTLMTFIVETVRQGRLLEFVGNSEDVLPMRKVETVKEVPPFWVINGDDDEMVPMEISENFIDKLKETHPKTPVHYTVQPGAHGFDAENVITDAWVKEGCEFIGKYWATSKSG